jgi:hypothetical protein
MGEIPNFVSGREKDYCGGMKPFEPFRRKFGHRASSLITFCRRNYRKSYEFSLLTRHDPFTVNAMQ